MCIKDETKIEHRQKEITKHVEDAMNYFVCENQIFSHIFGPMPCQPNIDFTHYPEVAIKANMKIWDKKMFYDDEYIDLQHEMFYKVMSICKEYENMWVYFLNGIMENYTEHEKRSIVGATAAVHENIPKDIIYMHPETYCKLINVIHELEILNWKC